MFRTSYRLTAAMGGMVSSSIAVMAHHNPDAKIILPPVSLIPVHNNLMSPDSRIIPVNNNLAEHAAASVGPGPGLDNPLLVQSLDTVTVDRGEEDGGEATRDQGEEYELVDVDVVRPNEQGRQQAEADKLKAAITKARDLCWCKMYESGTPGMIVGIAVNGKLVWQHGFGYSDVENKLLAGTGCVMRIASISKPITMAVLAKLVEEGKVDLDATLDKYLKDWPEKLVDGELVSITVRQLCSHLGGIRHYDKKAVEGKEKEKEEFDMKEYYIKDKFETMAKSVDLFRNDELMSKPGTEFLYSTHGFTLLAAVIEAVTEQPFDKYIKKQFKELGLNNTFLDENQPLIYNRARYYTRDKHHRLQNAPYVDNSYKWAGGGYLSNVSDLLKFGNAMLYSYQFTGERELGQEVKKKTDIPLIEKQNIEIPPKEKEKTEDDAKTGPEAAVASKTIEPAEKTLAKSIDYEDNVIEDVSLSRQVVYHPGPFAAVNKLPQKSAKVLPGYLSKKLMEELWTVQPNTQLSWGGDNLGYGLGWAVVPVNKKYGFCESQYYYVSHTGGAIGASSVLLIAPKKVGAGETKLPQGIVVAVLANLQGVGLNKLASSIAQAFEGLVMEKPVRVQKVYQC